MADAVSDDELLDGGQGLTSSEVFTLDEDDTHPGTKGMPRGGFTQVGYLTILRQFAVLGWTAFGGPAAHIATFEQVFVERKTWLSSNVFTEFLALGYVPHQTQPPRPRDRPRHRLADLPFSLSPASLSPHRQCIPGPTSTQMAFAIGVVKRGTSGGLLSGAMFLHPGFIMMSIIGATTGGYLSEPSAVVKGLVAGFTAVAIALVAGAAASLGRKICKDRVTLCICTFSIFVTVYARQAWVMPLLMVLGAAVTTGAYRKKDLSEEAAGTKGEGSEDITSLGLTVRSGAGLLGGWLGLLILLVIVRAAAGAGLWAPLNWFYIFYTAGSLIFGGGQVLLPLLLDKMATGDGALMTEDQFFAGLAVAQSMPGPLFNISAYLGAVIAQNAGYVSFLGTLIAWVALFSPGIMLIFGVLPFWGKFRRFPLYKRALPGINSAAVGLIFTAGESPSPPPSVRWFWILTFLSLSLSLLLHFWTNDGSTMGRMICASHAVFRMTFQAHDQSPFPKASTSIGVVAFTAVQYLKLPAPLAVIGGGCLGLIAHALKLQ